MQENERRGRFLLLYTYSSSAGNTVAELRIGRKMAIIASAY